MPLMRSTMLARRFSLPSSAACAAALLLTLLSPPASHASGGLLFSAPFLPTDTGQWPASVAIADLNGDARQDLAIVNYGSSTVSILLGNGDGTFSPKVDFATGTRPHSVAI